MARELFLDRRLRAQLPLVSKYAEALEVPLVPLISQVLALLLLVVAIAMKMTVIQELVEDPEFSEDRNHCPSQTLETHLTLARTW